jgi:hypothetical protein
MKDSPVAPPTPIPVIEISDDDIEISYIDVRGQR